MLGMHGTRYANLAVTECDLLIGLAARFDDRVVMNIKHFAPQATVIHIDIDPAEIGKVVATNVPLVGDAKLVLKALLPLLEKTDRSQWLARIEQLKSENPLTYNRDCGLKPQFVIEQLWNCTRGNAIIATDVGQHQMWVAQFYPFTKPRTLVSSGGLGCMGFGLPASVGAAMGAPGMKVILVTGRQPPDDHAGTWHHDGTGPRHQNNRFEQSIPGNGAAAPGILLPGTIYCCKLFLSTRFRNSCEGIRHSGIHLQDRRGGTQRPPRCDRKPGARDYQLHYSHRGKCLADGFGRHGNRRGDRLLVKVIVRRAHLPSMAPCPEY